MSERVVTTEMPWWDTKQWKPGEWYPLPIGFMARDQKEYIIDGYMIFRYDDEAKNGDIIPVHECDFRYLFCESLDICERHNNRKMID